jgi:pimeloyl-ACP methyl ester carboxylesterase
MHDGSSARTLSGEWIGELILNDSREFVRAVIDPDHSLPRTLDLPNQLRFRVPILGLAGDSDAVHFEVALQTSSTLTFTGRRGGNSLHGAIVQGDAHGTFWLQRTQSFDPAQFRRFVGDYVIGATRHVSLGLNSDPAWGGPYFFYAEGERVVRLYPVAESIFLSEHSEWVTLLGEDDEPTVLWKQPGNEERAARVRTSREEAVRIVSDSCELAGTLLVPHGDGPHPAVVLVHGSSPCTRDFYRLWAERFVRAGIAALVYDKRGCGESTGSADSSIADRAADAESTLTYLQDRPEIDSARVGLWGFSNGTWSIPLVAARRPDVAFLIAVGAVGVSPAQAELHRKRFELLEWGVPDEILSQVEQAWGIIYRYAATGVWEDYWDHDYPSLVAELSKAEILRHIPLPQYAVEDLWFSPIPPLITAEQLKASYGGVVPDMGVDPVTAYAQVRCPVLFLIGEHDSNVPVAESVRRVEQALHDGGNRDYAIETVPSAGHLLNVVGARIEGMSSAEASYRLHAFRFVPGVLHRMAAWAADHVNAHGT